MVNKYYFATYLLVLVAMIGLLVGFPDATSLHLWLNTLHTPALDIIFRNLSEFVEWPVYVLMLVVACWRWRWTAYYAASEGLSALLVQALKYAFHTPRPALVFGDDPAFRSIMVEGIHLRSIYSTPSGHTASFFIFFTVMTVVLSASKKLKCHPVYARILPVLMVTLATLGSFSRIYLSQHFLFDIVIGSAIGTTVPMLLLPLWHRLQRC